MMIFIIGSIWIGKSARADAESASHTVSLMYLDELAARREQVVEIDLRNRFSNMENALQLMEEDDLMDLEHLQAYQSKMKQLFTLEKFAFVDNNGVIYTSTGLQDDIGNYSFDYRTIERAEVSVKNLDGLQKKVIIAMPVDKHLNDVELVASFMEIDIKEFLDDISVESQADEFTICNIYTSDGYPLNNAVLDGLSSEENLLDALQGAIYENDNTYESFLEDFAQGRRGNVSFYYNGVSETMSYVPVKGTNWMLTYLVQKSVIDDLIDSISDGIVQRNMLHSAIMVVVLVVVFYNALAQIKRNAELMMEQESENTANKIKQEELERTLVLKEQLLEEEKKRTQRDRMITAMASDYRSVYYVDLDNDDAVCYRSDPKDLEQPPEGVHFPYLDVFTQYANLHVTEDYRDKFLAFIQPENIRNTLAKEPITALRYLAVSKDREYYEMIRVAGVRHIEDRDDHMVHEIGLGFTIIDAEMRQVMEHREALSDALKTADQANRAKSAFLSSMSHEIRTPMNAIIGLDNIALNDPETTPKIKGYLEKIGSSAEHLLNVINDILDMSRIESGRMTLRNEEFSFSKLLEAINTLYSGQCGDKNIEYNCRIIGQVDNYYIGDNMKLRQVLINILGNAVKFTEPGGKVSMTVERIAQYEKQTTIRFIISDTGIGMSKEFLPYIFDTFSQEDSSSTNKYGSSGLGMAISKSIVEMMNGNIQATSEKGKGSTFTVTITLADSPRSFKHETKEEIHLSDMSALVVDDDEIACENSKLMLCQAGVMAEVAHSGKEAVEMVKLRHARRQPYNLILVDWKMPDMDGVETTRQMRAIVGNESAIIILTAYRWDDVYEEALQAGVDSFVSKPIFIDEVMEEYKSAMKKKESEPKKKKADLAGKRILLAEDMQVNAEIMMMVLMMRNMETDHAENGQIAVDKFKDHPAGYYAAVLMDMRMPVMDGLEATRKIRALDREDAKRIPIIALTANAFDEDVQRSMQAGLNAHLSKPVQPDVLFETLESFIED